MDGTPSVGKTPNRNGITSLELGSPRQLKSGGSRGSPRRRSAGDGLLVDGGVTQFSLGIFQGRRYRASGFIVGDVLFDGCAVAGRYRVANRLHFVAPVEGAAYGLVYAELGVEPGDVQLAHPAERKLGIEQWIGE